MRRPSNRRSRMAYSTIVCDRDEGVTMSDSFNNNFSASRRRFVSTPVASCIRSHIARVVYWFSASRRRGARFTGRAILVLAFSLQNTWAGYRVEGGFVYRNYVSGSEAHFRFEVHVGHSGWLITARRDGVFRQFGHSELGCDGTNLFRVIYLNAVPYEIARAHTNQVFVNAWVTSGVTPKPDLSNSHFLWFAFVGVPWGKCSNSVPCTMVYDGLPPSCTLPAKVLKRDPSGNCIEEMAVFNPGFTYSFDEGPIPLPPPYNNRYTALEYRTQATTNIMDFCIPLSFHMMQFTHQRNTDTAMNDAVPVCAIEGHVTSVSLVQDPFPVVPRLEDAALIFDSRRADKKEAKEGYLSFTGWLDPALPAEVALGNKRARVTSPSAKRYIALGAMALLCAGLWVGIKWAQSLRPANIERR